MMCECTLYYGRKYRLEIKEFTTRVIRIASYMPPANRKTCEAF